MVGRPRTRRTFQFQCGTNARQNGSSASSRRYFLYSIMSSRCDRRRRHHPVPVVRNLETTVAQPFLHPILTGRDSPVGRYISIGSDILERSCDPVSFSRRIYTPRQSSQIPFSRRKHNVSARTFVEVSLQRFDHPVKRSQLRAFVRKFGGVRKSTKKGRGPSDEDWCCTRILCVCGCSARRQ